MKGAARTTHDVNFARIVNQGRAMFAEYAPRHDGTHRLPHEISIDTFEHEPEHGNVLKQHHKTNSTRRQKSQHNIRIERSPWHSNARCHPIAGSSNEY